MLSRAEAQSIAAKLTQSKSPGGSERVAKIGTHTTNGVKRHVVHVTHPDHLEETYTVARKDDRRVPA